MKSSELMDRCGGLSYRKLDYWCKQGVFAGTREPGRRRREFNEEDLRVAAVLNHVATTFNDWSGGRGGLVRIYREIADQIRAGASPVHITLADGIDITVAVDATPEPEPEPVAAEEVGFVPGVGADNA